ncbi:MAG TPA: acyltransferase [Patescibacteria group bacterium]|nr:acyltransferase [Patescibacteria group bacterium]
MKTKERYIHIDILRAIAILGVMLTHSLAVFLGPDKINIFWNYLHFVVVAFVGCSGYVTAFSYKRLGDMNLLSWYGKRFIRLYIPYALYVVSFALLGLLLPVFFHYTGISYTGKFFLSSFLLTGGVDVGWLTLLFIQLALITPLLVGLLNNKRALILFLTAIGLFTLVTAFFRIPTMYSRAIAWLPWAGIFLLGGILAQRDSAKTPKSSNGILLFAVLSFGTWLLLRFLLSNLHSPLTFTLHKYPPDLFYLSYGIAIAGVMYWVASRYQNRLQSANSPIAFLSKHSYGMFFLHLIILNGITTVTKHGSALFVSFISITLTILMTWIWMKITERIVSGGQGA